jgi:hypothetical protein
MDEGKEKSSRRGCEDPNLILTWLTAQSRSIATGRVSSLMP